MRARGSSGRMRPRVFVIMMASIVLAPAALAQNDAAAAVSGVVSVLAVGVLDVFLGLATLLLVGGAIVIYKWPDAEAASEPPPEPPASPQSLDVDRPPNVPSPSALGTLDEVPGDGLDALRGWDTRFSRPVLYSFLSTVQHAATAAVMTGEWPRLAPFVSDEVATRWSAEFERTSELGEVVVGHVRAELLEVGRVVRIEARVIGCRTEVGDLGRIIQRFEERWVLQRHGKAQSLLPGAMTSLRCPNCGAEVELDIDGCCVHCDEPQKFGHYQWQVVERHVEPRVPLEPLPLKFRYGRAPGEPVWRDSQLDQRLDRYKVVRDDFDLAGFLAHTRMVFDALVPTDSDPYAGRGLATPLARQQLAFDRLRFEAGGGVLIRDDVELLYLEPSHFEEDAFYALLTVRVWWRMRECLVVDDEVVDGDPNGWVVDSQYWTFMRRGESGKPGYTGGCSSCGAAFERIDPLGTCSVCRNPIADGLFGWVLAGIETIAERHGVGQT